MRSFSHYEILLVNFIVDVFASRGDFVNDIWNLTFVSHFRASFMTVSTYLIYTAPPVDFCLITLSPVDAYSVVPIYSLFILKFDKWTTYGNILDFVYNICILTFALLYLAWRQFFFDQSTLSGLFPVVKIYMIQFIQGV